MSTVRTEIIEVPTRLYRVGHRTHHEGLWYDRTGKATGRIHTIPGAAAAALPMGHHPVFRADGRHWLSVTDTPEALPNWFSASDMIHLLKRGYEVLAYDVERYRRLHFDVYKYAHEVVSMEDVRAVMSLNPATIYGELV